MGRIANVTATSLPQPDPDEGIFVGALRARGHEVEVVAWDDASVDWRSFDLAVIRSTWNYVHHVDAFRDWLARVSEQTRLENPAASVRWNLDKRYLRELAERGVPIVPTHFVELEDATPSRDMLARFDDVVIKPAVSAGSFTTDRFRMGDAAERARAEAFLDEHRRTRVMMVQPYQTSIDHEGERSLVFVDGELTHMMKKRPRFLSGPIAIEGPIPSSSEERALAAQVLAPFDGKLLYARVDVVPSSTGELQLMELEITEPYLTLDHHPPALDAFVSAVCRRLG